MVKHLMVQWRQPSAASAMRCKDNDGSGDNGDNNYCDNGGDKSCDDSGDDYNSDDYDGNIMQK